MRLTCLSLLLPLARGSYVLVSSGTCASAGYGPVESSSECESAASELALSDTSAHVHSSTSYPPYCWIMNGGNQLYYNTYTTSAYQCSSSYPCVCHLFASTHSPPSPPSPPLPSPPPTCLTCADILYTGSVWGLSATGVRFTGLGDNSLQFIGCVGNGCTISNFFCTDTTDGVQFGATGLNAAMRSCHGVDSIADCTGPTNVCCNVPRGQHRRLHRSN